MWLLLGGPCVCYFLLVSKIAVYIEVRYMHPIYAVAMVFIVLGIKRFLDMVLGGNFEGRLFLWALVLGVMTFGCYKNCTWPTLYLSSKAMLEQAASYQDVSCLYVYEKGFSYRANMSYMEVKNYKNLVFFEDNVDELEKMSDFCKEDEFILYIVNGNTERIEGIISQIMKCCPQIDTYEKINCFGFYATAYHLYGKDAVSDKGYLRNYDKTLYLGCEEGNENICVSQTMELLMTLQPKDVDYYNLYIQNGVVDLDLGVLAEGQNIKKFHPNGSDAQKWNLVENDDGSVTVYAYNSNYCLTYDDSHNVHISMYDSDSAQQKWWFEVK